MLLAIESDGRTVALTDQADVVARLNTDKLLRDTVRCVKRGNATMGRRYTVLLTASYSGKTSSVAGPCLLGS